MALLTCSPAPQIGTLSSFECNSLRGSFVRNNVRVASSQRVLPPSSVSKRIGVACSGEEKATEKTKPKKKGSEWLFYDPSAIESFESKLSKVLEVTKSRKGRVNTLFNDSFKYTSWIEVHRALVERNLKSIKPIEANELISDGSSKVVVLDVREAQDFEKLHISGALNAPLFRLIQGNDLKSNLRRLGYALITDFAGTERNPDFISQAEAAVAGNKSIKVIVVCSRGGTLETVIERKGPKAKKFADPDRIFGQSSRSLKAIYELLESGFTDVIHLEGGLNQWNYEGYPVEGTDAK